MVRKGSSRVATVASNRGGRFKQVLHMGELLSRRGEAEAVLLSKVALRLVRILKST